MNEILTWWDDAVTLAHTLAAGTRLKHRVTSVRDMVDGQYVVIGWRVDLADTEQLDVLAADLPVGTEPCS